MLRLPARFAGIILPFAAMFVQRRTWQPAILTALFPTVLSCCDLRASVADHCASHQMCVVSHQSCVRRPDPSQTLCVETGIRVRVEPFISCVATAMAV